MVHLCVYRFRDIIFGHQTNPHQPLLHHLQEVFAFLSLTQVKFYFVCLLYIVCFLKELEAIWKYRAGLSCSKGGLQYPPEKSLSIQ